MLANDEGNKWHRSLMILIVVLSFLYLAAIPFGKIKEKLGIVEAVILALLLLILSGFVNRLAKFAISDKGFEVELTEVQKEVAQQRVEQERQKAEIASLKFLISYFVTDAELKHLEGLVSGNPYPYHKASYFVSELRRLRAFGLIQNFPDKGIRAMPSEGNLKDFFFVTDRGRNYLSLRQEVDAENPTQANE